jgi:hypothetical protein
MIVTSATITAMMPTCTKRAGLSEGVPGIVTPEVV